MTKEEIRKIEGEKLSRLYRERKVIEPHITHQKIADHLELKSVSQVTQWLSGRSPISDRNLFRLADRLDFNAFDVRERLSDYNLPSSQLPAIALQLQNKHGIEGGSQRFVDLALATVGEEMVRAVIRRLEDRLES